MAATPDIIPYFKIPTTIPISFGNVQGLSEEFVNELNNNGYKGQQHLMHGCFFWSLFICLSQSLIPELNFMTDSEKHLMVLHLLDKSKFRNFNNLLNTELDEFSIQLLCDLFKIQIRFYSYNPMYTNITKIDDDEYIHISTSAHYLDFNGDKPSYPQILIWSNSDHYSALKEIIPNYILRSDGATFMRELHATLQNYELTELPKELHKDYCDPETLKLIDTLTTTPDTTCNDEDIDGEAASLKLAFELADEDSINNNNNDDESASIALARLLAAEESGTSVNSQSLEDFPHLAPMHRRPNRLTDGDGNNIIISNSNVNRRRANRINNNLLLHGITDNNIMVQSNMIQTSAVSSTNEGVIPFPSSSPSYLLEQPPNLPPFANNDIPAHLLQFTDNDEIPAHLLQGDVADTDEIPAHLLQFTDNDIPAHLLQFTENPQPPNETYMSQWNLFTNFF